MTRASASGEIAAADMRSRDAPVLPVSPTPIGRGIALSEEMRAGGVGRAVAVGDEDGLAGDAGRPAFGGRDVGAGAALEVVSATATGRGTRIPRDGAAGMLGHGTFSKAAAAGA